jgi:hypothetical protein
MTNKVIATLALLTMFALGCATASVLVSNAKASRVSGAEECTGMVINLVDPAQATPEVLSADAVVLPPGWRAVGGTSHPNGMPAVVVCHTLP